MGSEPPADDVIDAPGGEVAYGVADAGEAPVDEAPISDAVSEAIWALWTEVDRIRQELEAGRLAQERQGLATSEAVAEAIHALRGQLDRTPNAAPASSPPGEGEPGEAREVAFPYAMLALPGQVQQLQSHLLEDRAERQRFEAALPTVVRTAVERVQDALAEEARARLDGDATLLQELRAEFDKLRDERRGDRPGASSGDAPALPKVVRAALDELRFQLVEERGQREARDASIVPILQAVDVGLAALRSDISADRTEHERRLLRFAEAMVGRFDDLRTELRTDSGDRDVRDAAQSAAQSAAAATALQELRQDMAGEREEREARAAAEAQQSAAQSAAIVAAVQELREEVAAERADREGRDGSAAAQSAAIAAAMQELRDDVAGDRAERGARDAAVSAVAAGLQRLRDELGADRGQRGAVAAAVEALGHDVADERTKRASRDGAISASLLTLQAQLGELREELFRERRRREEREAALPGAVGALQAQLGEVREALDTAIDAQLGQIRAALDTAIPAQLGQIRAALETVIPAQLGGVREALDLAIPAAAGPAHAALAALGELREDIVQDLLQRESFATAVNGALEALRGQFAEARAELTAQREILAALQALFFETRREQEALAFQLPEATRGMQERVTEVQTRNLETLQQLESLLRTTMGGANSWFLRTRDELVTRMDQLAAMADLGIAESTVAVLEVLRADVMELRNELAALSARPHLTAAQVRKIVKDLRAEAEAPKPVPANAKPAQRAKAAPTSPA